MIHHCVDLLFCCSRNRNCDSDVRVGVLNFLMRLASRESSCKLLVIQDFLYQFVGQLLGKARVCVVCSLCCVFSPCFLSTVTRVSVVTQSKHWPNVYNRNHTLYMLFAFAFT